MLVADELHLDMPRPLDQLFEIHLVLAEGGLGLPPAFTDFMDQRLLVHDPAHAAPAAAPRCLQHQRIADLRGHLLDGVHIVGQRVRRRHYRHLARDRHVACGDLVAEIAHGLRARSDENDAVFLAGFGKFR